VITLAVRCAAHANVTSLLEHTEAHWRQLGGGRSGGKYGRARAFLGFARDVVETLRDGIGWESEYSRDVWRLARLPGLVITAGQIRQHAQLRFDRIT
jgi:hypothetical protein